MNLRKLLLRVFLEVLSGDVEGYVGSPAECTYRFSLGLARTDGEACLEEVDGVSSSPCLVLVNRGTPTRRRSAFWSPPK